MHEIEKVKEEGAWEKLLGGGEDKAVVKDGNSREGGAKSNGALKALGHLRSLCVHPALVLQSRTPPLPVPPAFKRLSASGKLQTVREILTTSGIVGANRDNGNLKGADGDYSTLYDDADEEGESVGFSGSDGGALKELSTFMDIDSDDAEDKDAEDIGNKMDYSRNERAAKKRKLNSSASEDR